MSGLMRCIEQRWVPGGVVGLLASCLVVSACGDNGGGGPSVDSGSHWLRPCAADADCNGSDLSCVCGLCTQTCANTPNCGGFGDGAACVDPTALNGAECGAAPPDGLCAATCEVPADCPDPAMFDCETGLCSAIQPPDACSDAECGPAPGMPNTLCEDGVNMSGPTGSCVETPGGTCAWEIADCPNTDPTTGCTPNDCGPAPGAPNELCPDGSLGGPACLPDADGACTWQLIECTEDPGEGTGENTCNGAACGEAPGMPNWECADGTIAGPACLADPAAGCGWQIIECPDGAAACPDDACGPAPGMPNTLCPDGENVAGPTGRCLQTADGTCGWEIVQCPE